MDKVNPLHGLQGSIDKVGIVSLEIPTLVRTLMDAITVAPPIEDAELFKLGLRLVGRRFNQTADGSGFLVNFSIEGGQREAPEVNFESRERKSAATFAIEGSMAEDPIESHPNFTKIAKQYAWQKEKKEFKEEIPNAKVGGDALRAKRFGTTPTIRNPLAGVSSYLNVGMILSITTSAKQLPVDIFDKIGCIFDLTGLELPNGVRLPRLGGKRNWLRLAPTINERGGILEIIERYQLSGPNGWIAEIYDRDQLYGGR